MKNILSIILVISQLSTLGQVVIYREHCHSGTTAFVFSEIIHNDLHCFDKSDINDGVIDISSFTDIVSRAKKRKIVQQKYGKIDLAGEYISQGKIHIFIVLLPNKIINFTEHLTYILKKKDEAILEDWCASLQP